MNNEEDKFEPLDPDALLALSEDDRTKYLNRFQAEVLRVVEKVDAVIKDEWDCVIGSACQHLVVESALYLNMPLNVLLATITTSYNLGVDAIIKAAHTEAKLQDSKPS